MHGHIDEEENDVSIQQYFKAHGRRLNREDWWELPLVLLLVAFLAYEGWGLRGLGPVAIITVVLIVWLIDETGILDLIALIVGLIALIVYGLIAWQVV